MQAKSNLSPNLWPIDMSMHLRASRL